VRAAMLPLMLRPFRRGAELASISLSTHSLNPNANRYTSLAEGRHANFTKIRPTVTLTL
jgi:hypothetical protein